MTPALRLSTRLARSAALLAAAAAGPAYGQAGDPFAGGAYAVPTAPPVAVAYGDPATLSPGTVITGPSVSGPTPSGGPVYMAPEVVGSPQSFGAPMMGSPMPGSPGCNCNAGGAAMMGSAPMVGAPILGDPSMAGLPMAAPGYGAPMGGPCGCPPAYDDGCCLTGCCLTGCCLGSCLAGDGLGIDGAVGGPVGACDPCQAVAPPICDPCQATPPCYPGPGGGGLYQGMGGAQRCGWAAGYTFVFLKPFFGTNDAFAVTTLGPGLASNTVAQDFSYSLDLGSRVFVEKIGRRDLGVRATYFTLNTGADAATVAVPGNAFATTSLGTVAGPGDTLTAGNHLRLNVVDIDITQRLSVWRSLVNVGGGVRWAELNNRYTADISGPLTGGIASSAGRRFDGIGPSVFAELRRPLGMSRFSVIAAVRGSMLYGQGTNSVNVETTGLGGPTSFRSESDDFVAVGESQLGVEWSTWISRQTVLFVQTAWETQYWLGVGTALDRNDDLGLFGFNTSVGFEW